VEIEQVIEATGWELKVIDSPVRTPTPTAQELTALRDLTSR
jgi:hypothetical protein